MEKTHYLKAANKLKDAGKYPIQVIDILENQNGEIIVYLKQFEKFDTKGFKADLEATVGGHVTLQMLGAREVVTLIGGMGRCDQEVCCHKWLDGALNPSVQSLADQNIKGIPSDYLGLCGKLLCCLLYETADFKLECAYGVGLRQKLKLESPEVQQKVADVAREVKEAKKPRRFMRRVLR